MFQRPRIFTATAALAGAAIIGAGGGAATYAAFSSGNSKTVVRQVTVAGSDAAATNASLSVSQIYNRTNKGVVEITVTSTGQTTPFGGSQSQQAQGSGFVYDDSGHIITNQHVVDGANSISVKFWNGASYKATLVGSDASTDLAVIQVDAPSSLLHPLSLGDSSKLAVGDGVVAIGSPFGLEETVTSGIVSALHRSMTAPNDFTINDSIQTDAAINHGNSGGPLLNMQGRVIGVNSQIESDSGGSDGVGFAIPSNTVRSIASQLISSGNVSHAYLGVGVETIPSSVASALGVPAGVELAQVRSGTPAAQAGLRASTGTRTIDGQEYPTGGDVVTAIDGEAVSTSAELQARIDAKRPGDTVSITYSRGGKSHTVQVKLATRPS
jgi:putative serine protease PepD